LKPRDIKPANIKLTPKGQIILLDFGLAKGGVTQQTVAGRSLYGYTPGYAPPEQIEGMPTDERSDLYALAATLYALLTGQKPDDPISRRKYMKRGLPDLLSPANQVNAQVPPHVAQALQQAMVLEPTERPDSAVQMRAMLNAPPTQPIALSVSTVPPSSDHKPPQSAQTTSPSPLIGKQAAAFESVETESGGNNRQLRLWGAIMAAILIVGVLVSAYIVRGSRNAITPTETTSQDLAAQVAATQAAAANVTPDIPSLAPDATAIAQKDGMVQVYVSAGEFEMGSADDDPDAQDDEKPRHTVYLDAFWIDQTEVTNAMFANFVAETGYQTDAGKEGSGWTCLSNSDGQLDCGYVGGGGLATSARA